MTPLTEFYINISLSFLGALILAYFMHKAQKRKEKEADEKYEFALKLIEMRNKKIGDKNEPS